MNIKFQDEFGTFTVTILLLNEDLANHIPFFSAAPSMLRSILIQSQSQYNRYISILIHRKKQTRSGQEIRAHTVPTWTSAR